MPLNLGLLRSDLDTLLQPPDVSEPPPPTGTVQIVTGPGVVVFKLNGVAAWFVDEKMFGGTPVLTFSSDRGSHRIELKGALYPGTSLSADFVCILAPKRLFGTPMNITMTLGDFHGHATLEPWLAGSAQMTSGVTLDNPACSLGVAGKLTCQGAASADFAPNWQTAYHGGSVASIAGLGAPHDSDSFTLRLLTPQDPSLRSTPKKKRTLMTLVRGSHSWDLKPTPLSFAIGTIAPQPNLFDRIDVEAGENSATDVDHLLVAQGTATDKLQLAPGGGLTDPDGKPLIVALAMPRFAIDFETTQTFLAAHFPGAPIWIRAEAFAMEVGDVGILAPFEVDADNGTVKTLTCAPVLRRAAAPLAGDLAARPLQVDGTPRLHFVSKPGTKPGWGVLAASDVAGQPKVSLPQFAVALVRRDDLLSLEVDFLNLALEGGGGIPPRLVRADSTKDAYLIARFNAPQNIAEQAFLETSLPPPVTGPPVSALAAGPSRLAFKLGAGMNSVDYSVTNLLDWKQYDLSIAPAAALPDPPPAPANPFAPAPPQPNETAIEAPWHLIISPNSTAGFAHATSAVTHGIQTELWHTRLGVKKVIHGEPTVDEVDSTTRKIRAIWSPDFVAGPPPIPGGGPFLMSLDSNARDQIVVRSSDFSNPHLPPKAVDVDRLMLSSLGAWMDVDGRWTAQKPFDLEEWRHRAAMGRDSYVKVVFAGHLCPFGHRAVLVVVTERKFLLNPAGNTTAYLIQREFIVVKEPEKDYGYLATTVPGQGRNFPYRKVRITTLVTPNLNPNNHLHFFPSVGTAPFLFHLVGTDREGRTSEFTAPLVWVALGQETAGIGDYLTAAPSVRKRDLAGQEVAFAQSSKPGDTSLHTSAMTFSVLSFPPFIQTPAEQPPFSPILDPNSAADVTIPALQQINGTAGAVPIKFYSDYVTSDFKKGGVFLELVSSLGVAFGGDKTGGVATPNLNVGGLSRSFGTVSGAGAALDTFAGGKFDPAAYFGGITDAKLLGFIPLTAIITAINDVTSAPDKTPKLLTTRNSTEIVTNLAWIPDVHNWNTTFANLNFTAPPDDPANPAHMELDVTIRTPIGGGNPDATVQGHLRTFDLHLLDVILLHFKSVSFIAQPGKKLDLTADLGDVKFEGDLSFLNQLEKLIPSNGFSDPPSVDVTAKGVTVGYSLAIPSVGVGVFSLENIRFSAALALSFVGDPIRFRLAFCEREHPFLVTVSLLGGGGFFGLQLGPDGIEMLEASIEFGANVSLDLVVASANVHIMAGVYLKLDFTSKASQLTGYLRAGGSASVLGLITVSVEFYLGFTYYATDPCKIAGEASVTVEIDILFFSASVSVSLRREFADPQISFADLIRPSDWNEYCDAFAA